MINQEKRQDLFISHINKLASFHQKSLGLSEKDLYQISLWWAKYVQNVHLKGGDLRQKDCNFVIVAMENDKGVPIFRWETYHNLVKQSEYLENNIEGVLKVVYGSEQDKLVGLGLDWWELSEDEMEARLAQDAEKNGEFVEMSVEDL